MVGSTMGAVLGACSSGGSGNLTTSTTTSGTTTSGTTTSGTTTSGTTTSGTTTSSAATTSSGGGSTTSSSAGTGGATTTTSSSGGGSTTTTTTTTTASSSSTTTSSGAPCTGPGTLHPSNPDAGPGTIYCPFSGVDGGKDMYCTPGTQHCCETPEGSSTPSACVPIGTACVSGSTDWQCEDPATDCPASNPVCCAQGATWVDGGTMNGMVCQNYASMMTGTVCTTQAQCNGIIICATQAECTSIGKTGCDTFSKAGNQVGACN
jgi:mucin-2